MLEDQQILDQLQQLNRKLDIINNPLKNAAYNFIAGIFHSLGSLFGTVIIAGLIFYFASKVDLVKPVTGWVETVLNQINWSKVIPTPTYDQNSLNQLFGRPTP
jgi:hypothetical protein